jgi:hypothetical protein
MAEDIEAPLRVQLASRTRPGDLERDGVYRMQMAEESCQI